MPELLSEPFRVTHLKATSVFAERLDIARLELEAAVAAKDVLQANDERGPQSYQVHALTQKIVYWPVFPWINISLGQYPQPQHFASQKASC